MNRLEEMEAIEKAVCLYQLLPDEIPPFFTFYKSLVEEIIEKKGRTKSCLEQSHLLPEEWVTLARRMKVILRDEYFILKTAAGFAESLFTFSHEMFSEHCLRTYLSDKSCVSLDFKRAAQLFFINEPLPELKPNAAGIKLQ